MLFLHKPTLMIASSNLLMAELIQNLCKDIQIEVNSIVTAGDLLFEKIFENKPDFVLVDSELKGCNGIGFFKKLERIPVPSKVIIYSFSHNTSYLRCFLSSKAVGYIQNGCSLDEFKKCLENILEGKRVIHSNLNADEVNNSQQNDTGNSSKYDISVLTEREKAIWELIIQEMTEREIAEKLFISINTVRTHKSNIATKIGIKNKKRLTRIASNNYSYMK